MPAYTFILSPGVVLPQDSGYTLLSALSKPFPFLHGARVQIAPVRGTRMQGSTHVQTDHKSRLHVRGITQEQADQISGSWIMLLGRVLGIGTHTEVDLRTSPYLASRLVVLHGSVEAKDFQNHIEGLVPGATVKLGRRRALHLKGKKFLGYAVHLAGLSDEQSTQVQATGLGKYTSMGCGVFYPGHAGG